MVNEEDHDWKVGFDILHSRVQANNARNKVGKYNNNMDSIHP